MAVEKSKIKERLKALFPGVNLSKERIEQISTRLAPKPADDAEDSAIDQFINDANDFMPFADIAKEDDRVRTLVANQKPPSTTVTTTTETGESQNQEQSDLSKLIAQAVSQAMAPLAQKVEAYEKKEQQLTKKQKAAALLPEVSEEFRELLLPGMPENEEEQTAWADKGKAAFTASIQLHNNANLGSGLPPKGTPNGNTKEASKDKIDAVYEKIKLT